MKRIPGIWLLLLPLVNLFAVPQIREKVTIDGDLSDPVWEKLEWRSGFTKLGSKTPAEAQTRFKTFHDGSSLYFAVECDEPEMSKVRTAWNPGSWQNDSIEINLVPDAKILSFYKVIADVNGGSQDMFGQDDNTDRGIYLFNGDWRSSARIRSRKGKDRWTVEAAIPFGAINYASSDSDRWRINIGRNRWTVKPVELSSWSHLPERNHVIPKAFNEVTVQGFSPAGYQYDIENFKSEILPDRGKQSCRVSANIHNNTKSFRIFRQTGSLTDLKTGKVYSCRNTIRLQANAYQPFAMTIPEVPNGEYLFRWELASNRKEPVLLKQLIRKVTLDYIPLKATLKRPAYRNNIYATMPDKTIEAQIELREFIGMPLTAELTGNGVREIREIARSTGSDTVEFDGAKLADGRYTLTVSGKKDGRKLAVSVKIRKLPYRKGEVWVDRRGATYVDGKLFMPFGWYGTHGPRFPYYNTFVTTARFKDMESAKRFVGNNYRKDGIRSLVIPFQDLAGYSDWRWVIFKDPETRKKGLTPEQRKKIIEFVSGIGKEEGLMGYYMADEPECRDNNPVWYEEARDLIAEIDPYHPCFMLNWGITGIRRYYKGCDILLPDCYPQYFEDGSTGKPRWRSSDYAKVSTSLRPAWQMPQASCWPDLSRDGKLRGIAPTYDDLRSQIFQAVIHNVKGFNLYAWFDSQRFASVILGPPEIGKTLIEAKEYMLENSVPDGVTVKTAPNHPQFQAGLKIHDGKICLIAVNTSMQKIKADFQLKKRFSGTLYREGAKISKKVKDGTFSDVFAPNETRIYFSDREMAAKLTPAADTAAAIVKFRAGRKKPGNLVGQGEMSAVEYTLYGEKGKLAPGVPKIKASSDAKYYMTQKTGSLYYLIDGLTEPNRPEYTWKPLGHDRKPYLEFQLSAAAPLKTVKLYTPCGNLKSGRVVVNGKEFPFENAQNASEITVELDGTKSDLVRIEFVKFSYAGRGDEVSNRLLTEVEIY